MFGIAVSLVITLCIGGAIGLIGIALLVFGWSQRKKGSSTQNWPATTGTILSASLNQQSRRNQQGYHDITYAPVVEYTYDVNGQTYRSDTISSGWVTSYSLDMAQKKLSSYQPGSTIAVHYNPGNPAEAVLETKSASGNVFVLAGSIILVFGIGISCCVLGSSLFTNGLTNSIQNLFR